MVTARSHSAVAYDSGGGAGWILISDVNRDGKPDLLVGNGSLGVLLGKGDGTFKAVVTYSSGALAGPVSVCRYKRGRCF